VTGARPGHGGAPDATEDLQPTTGPGGVDETATRDPTAEHRPTPEQAKKNAEVDPPA